MKNIAGIGSILLLIICLLELILSALKNLQGYSHNV